MIMLSNYSEFVESMWFSSDDRKMGLGIATLGLAGETGEVSEIIKKHLRGDGEVDVERLKKELGDVSFYHAKIANYFGISLDDVLRTNMEKLQSRKDRGVLRGSGDNR